MNILLTTLGTSWQIVPELYGFTNPQQYDFFAMNEVVEKVRKENNILPVDEIWCACTEGVRDADKIEEWSKKLNVKIRLVVCKGVCNFSTQQEVVKMRSLIYRLALKASETVKLTCGRFYISLAGGRKTMSADIQDAAGIFGYDAMIHIMDVGLDGDVRKNFNSLALIDDYKSYSKYFMPVIINGKTAESAIATMLMKDYPFEFSDELITAFEENGEIADEIQKLKNKSSQLYANFYHQLNVASKKRDLFKEIYFLSPAILKKIQSRKISSETRDLLKRLPKCELHSHLGGVLSPVEIIQVALSEKEMIDDFASKNSEMQMWKKSLEDAVRTENLDFLNSEKETYQSEKRCDKLFFEKNLLFISCFSEHEDLFKKLIYGNLLEDEKFFKIGIDNYQKLGDFQGSALLQTKNTIRKAVELYARNLTENNVKYVEIRCSPHKYTKCLRQTEVLDVIMDAMRSFAPEIEYRIILIINRESNNGEIQEIITDIEKLLEENSLFAQKFAGIDLAGNEGKNLPENIRESFRPFFKNCIHFTIHAGETQSEESIRQAIYELNADRIGHGLNFYNNPELKKIVMDKNIGIEMCPSSNFQIVGFKDNHHPNEKEYPLLKYLNDGYRVTINTDDQGISMTNITNEFLKAAELCPELSLWDVIVLIRNSLSIAFIDYKTRARLMHEFETEIAKILAEEFA